MRKKKAGMKMLAWVLTVVMFLTMQGMPELSEAAAVKAAEREMPKNPVHHCTKDDEDDYGENDTTDWSYVYFGSYPQTEVTGDDLTTAITGASYDANGDAWVNGIKYRRISKSDTNRDTNPDEYFGDNTYCYFKWERIKWRVLRVNGSTVFVTADKGLDCKDYNEEYTFITWENCTLRSWLNNDFYEMAFSSGEQGAIVSQTVVNEDNPYYNAEGGNNTTDKVYLLSLSEVMNPDYGFCEDYSIYSVSRRVKVSDYAHARGAYVYKDKCIWRLRSPGDNTYSAASVDTDGSVYRSGYYVNYDSTASVPALHIDLSSDLWSLTDDGTSGEGGVSNPNDSSIQCKSSCTVEKGNTANITVQAYGDDYDSLKQITDSVTWKSQNPSIATVKGKKFTLSRMLTSYHTGNDVSYKSWSGISNITITGVAKGSTTITGTAFDGSVVTCKVTVEEKDDGSIGSGGMMTLGEKITGIVKGGVTDFFPGTFSLNRMNFPLDIRKVVAKDDSYKIRGTIGIKRSNLLDDETEWWLYKKNIEDFKKAESGVVNLQEIMQKKGARSERMLNVEKFKWIPSISCMGYFENSYDKNGNLISHTGKIAADAQWKAGAEWQFLTPIGPVYFNLAGSGKLSGEIGPIYNYEKNEVKFADGNLKFTPKISPEGGYGINKIAMVGVNGEASVPITIIPMSKGEFEAKASLHVKAAFVIDFNHELASYRTTIWETKNNNQKGAKVPEINFSEGVLSEMDTSFAAYTSEWNGSRVNTVESVDATGNNENVSIKETMLQDGILPSSLPMQAEINGKRILVFQAYDSARNTLDSSVLKYSVYENGVWSNPQPVWDNGCSDLFADMKVVNDRLVLVWQKEKAEITGDIEQDSQNVLQKIAENSEICFAEFDETSKTFINQTYVTNNQEYDMMPRILDGSNRIIVSWVRNDSAELMQETGKNTIYTAEWNGVSFETETLLAQSVGTVDDFITYQDEEGVKAVYVGEYGEEEEKATAVLNEKNQVIESLSELSRSETSGSVSGMHYDNGRINFFSDGMLYSYNPNDQTAVANLAGESAFGSTAKFCSNGEKSGYIWSVYDEETDTGSIVASMKEEDSYCEPMTLYEKKGDVARCISLTLDENGNWSFVVNTQQTEIQTGEHNALVYIEKQSEAKTELAEASVNVYDVDDMTGIDYYLKNTGDEPVEKLQIEITFADGTVQTKEIPVTILPGESVADTAYVDLSDVDSAQEVSIRIYANGQADMKNCTVTDMVGLSDVAVTGTVRESGNNVIVTADVSNISTMDAETTLYLYSDETQTKELCDPQTEVITANGKKQFQMTVKKRDVTYNKNNAAYLTLKAVVKDGDYNEDNNVSYAILYKPKATSSVNNPNQNYNYDYKPDKVKLKKVKSNKKGELSVKWKYVGASGYQIQYALNKTFTKGKRTKNVDLLKSNITLKKLKSKKKYFVRVRAYNKKYYLFSDGYYKVYGPWSNVKKCKVK